MHLAPGCVQFPPQAEVHGEVWQHMPVILEEGGENIGALPPGTAVDAAADLGSQSQQEVRLAGPGGDALGVFRTGGGQRTRAGGIAAIEGECSGFAVVTGVKGIEAVAPVFETQMEDVLSMGDRHRILKLNYRIGKE